MRSNASLIYSLFLVVGDFLALLAAFVVAYIARVSYDPRPLINQIQAVDYVHAFLLVLPLWILLHGLIGLYSQQIYEKRFAELGRLFIGSFLGILVLIGYDFVTDGSLFPARLVPVYGLVLAFLFLLSFRSIARILRTELFAYKVGVTNLLIVGDTPLSIELVRELIHTKHSGYRVLGVVSREHESHKQYQGLRIFATFQAAVEELGVNNIHSIMQTELYTNSEKNNEILTTAQEHHIAYRFVPGNTELFVGNIQVDLFHGIPVIAVHQTALLGWGRIFKRLFDIIVSLIALVLLSPLMLLLAVLIAMTGGPVFYSRKRLTRFNSYFVIYKFTTLKKAYTGMDPEEGFAKMGRPDLAVKFRQNGDFLEDDPRISKIGNFLRKTSLDELPQLFNVLRGDISLVGPRALIEEELNKSVHKHVILSIKPGLTGLAVVSGRRDIPFEERRRLDAYYAQNWSFWLDLIILLKTIRIVIGGRGAR